MIYLQNNARIWFVKIVKNFTMSHRRWVKLEKTGKQTTPKLSFHLGDGRIAEGEGTDQT